MQVPSLHNTGISMLNGGKSNDERKTIIVVGLARSGTTFIAKCLKTLDVFIGSNLDSPVLEDLEICHLLESNKPEDNERLDQIIDDRNEKYSTWGFKRPKAYRYIAEYDQRFRNTHYIIPIRDTLAIAVRNQLSINSNLMTNLESSCYEMIELVRFIKLIKRPVMLVSYEKTITENKSFNKALLQFLKIPADQKILNNLAQCLQLNSSDYLLNTRIHKIIGRLDGLRDEKQAIKGWAKHMDKEDPVKLKIYINNQLVGKVEANIEREDLADKGKCAFSYKLSDADKKFQGACQIRVISENGNFELNNSPLIVKL